MNARILKSEIAQTQARLAELLGVLEEMMASSDRFSVHVHGSRAVYRHLADQKRTGHEYGSDLDACVKSSYRKAKKLGFAGTELEWAQVLVPPR